jgi:hypothetical protein
MIAGSWAGGSPYNDSDLLATLADAFSLEIFTMKWKRIPKGKS